MNTMAEDLSRKRFRFLTDVQIGVLRRQYGLSKDEVRSAAIMADRIRRRQQIEEGREGFTVADLVPMDAPIEVKQVVKPGGKRRLRLHSRYEKVCKLKNM